MPEADLYRSRVDYCRYCPAGEEAPCRDFLARVKAGQSRIEDFPSLTPRLVQRFRLAMEPEAYLPPVPLVTVPQPIEPGLYPLNEPDADSLVLVSSNNSLTFELLATVWAQGVTPAHLLLVDCLGNTVDMAMVYGVFTPERLRSSLEASGLNNRAAHRSMIVPGLTAPLTADFAAATNWRVEAGPICALELPLFLRERWASPEPE